jgi:hypothetical protein
MGLLWLFAEGFCLLFARWAYYNLLSGENMRKQKGFILILLSCFLPLIFITFGQPLFWPAVSSFFNSSSNSLVAYYYSFLWRFFCTLWVLIEGAIAIYVLRIKELLARGRGPVEKRRNMLMYSFIFFCILFSIFYEANSLNVALHGAVKWQQIVNLSRFYIKICGFWWILIEWAVAIMGWQIYRTLAVRKRVEQ